MSGTVNVQVQRDSSGDDLQHRLALATPLIPCWAQPQEATDVELVAAVPKRRMPEELKRVRAVDCLHNARAGFQNSVRHV